MWFSESNCISCRLSFFLSSFFLKFLGGIRGPHWKPVFRIRSTIHGLPCWKCCVREKDAVGRRISQSICFLSPCACKAAQLAFGAALMEGSAVSTQAGLLPAFPDSRRGGSGSLRHCWREQERQRPHLRCFCFTFAIIYSQIALQGNVPFSYFTPPFLINELSLQ